jgi:hypothetical protein
MATMRQQARNMGYRGSFGGGKYRRWWMDKSKSEQQRLARQANGGGGGGQQRQAASSSGGGRDWGDKPAYNKQLAEDTGYQGDFGSGGFSRFWLNSSQSKRQSINEDLRTNPLRDYGRNAERNFALAQEFPSFVHNFGDGAWTKFYQGSSPSKQGAIDTYLNENWDWQNVLESQQTEEGTMPAGAKRRTNTNRPVRSKGKVSGNRNLAFNPALEPGAGGGTRRRVLLG